MNMKWYDYFVKKIYSLNENKIILIDIDNILKFEEITNKLENEYEIINESNSIKIRYLLKKNGEKFLLVTNSENNIPYDLLQEYSSIKIGLNNIFKGLYKKELVERNIDELQKIYDHLISHPIYGKKSKEETKTFVKESLGEDSNYKILGKINKIKIDIKKILEEITKQNEKLKIQYEKYGLLSQKIGKIKYLLNKIDKEDKEVSEIVENINKKFSYFLKEHYDDLSYDTNTHLNSDILNVIFSKNKKRKAILCFDCMGFEEWNVVKEYLKNKVNIKIINKFSYSILPSETKYSRLSLFSGKTPKEILEKVFVKDLSLRYEEKLFKIFLTNERLNENEIYYKKGIKYYDKEIIHKDFNNFSAVGLIFSFIDKMAHNNVSNKRILSLSIEEKLTDIQFDKIIDNLLGNKYEIYITSDHGNIKSIGNGEFPPKDLFVENSKRYLISNKKEFYENYLNESNISVKFNKIIGDKYMLLMNNKFMFGSNTNKHLNHGGATIQEVIVPFIEVKR